MSGRAGVLWLGEVAGTGMKTFVIQERLDPKFIVVEQGYPDDGKPGVCHSMMLGAFNTKEAAEEYVRLKTAHEAA